jgi:hypothetical protein
MRDTGYTTLDKSMEGKRRIEERGAEGKVI